MAIADLRARLAGSAAAFFAVSLVVAGCSSLIGVPDVPQPSDGGEEAGGETFDAQGSPDSSVGTDAAQGTDAPAADDSATPVVDAGGG
jgi:hypothetical protein